MNITNSAKKDRKTRPKRTKSIQTPSGAPKYESFAASLRPQAAATEEDEDEAEVNQTVVGTRFIPQRDAAARAEDFTV